MFWSIDRVQIKEINQQEPQFLAEWSCTKEKINERGPHVFVKWSCTKERINERGPYTFVKWLCANKRNKLIRILTFARVVVHKEKHETEPSFRCCCFPQGSNKYLLFNSDIEKFELKINGGRDKRSHFFFSFYLFFILFYFIIFLFIYSSIFCFLFFGVDWSRKS